MDEEVQKKRDNVPYSVMPYLLGFGSPKKVEKIHLVWGDSHTTELPTGTQPLKAVDILFKSFSVLCLPYYLGWKNFFRFLSFHLYKIPLDNNRLSTYDEKYLQLMAED